MACGNARLLRSFAIIEKTCTIWIAQLSLKVRRTARHEFRGSSGIGDWRVAMVFRRGKKYQDYVCSNGCLCCDPDQWAGIPSRRGFLMGSGAAAVAAPVILAADSSDVSQDRLPSMVVKGYSPPFVNDDDLVAKLSPALTNHADGTGKRAASDRGRHGDRAQRFGGAPYKVFGIYNTEYRTVTNLTNKRYFFELTTAPNVFWTDLTKFDLSVGAPVMLLDPSDITLSGDVTGSFKKAAKAPY